MHSLMKHFRNLIMKSEGTEGLSDLSILFRRECAKEQKALESSKKIKKENYFQRNKKKR